MDASARRTRDAPIIDRTWERVTALNQFTLGGIVLVVCGLLIISNTQTNFTFFLAGVVMIFTASGVALVVPWGAVPIWGSMVLPLIDIVAIGLLRESAPSAGLGTLWMLPAIWLSSQFAFRGLVVSLGAIVGLQVWLVIETFDEAFAVDTVLVPLVIAAVSLTTYATARRSGAQRRLLRKQSRMLEGALARARRQEMTVTQVLDAVDFGVIRITADGEIAMMNEAQGRLQAGDRLGTYQDPGERARATHLAELTGPESDERNQVNVYREDGVTRLVPAEFPFARALRGESLEAEVLWFGEPGTPRRALSVTVRRLAGADGSDDGAVLVFRDVTAELSAIRSREDLVASVSHELRTPLTSIVGYIELVLDDDQLQPSSRRGLEVAARNANRLLAIVADILAASTSGEAMAGLSIDPDDANLADIVWASVEAVAPRAAERDLRVDTSGVEPALAYIDAARIRQVVDNLISNAVKYNRDGGTIEISCTSDGRNAWLVVRDTGMGISQEELPRLFERFFRAASVRNTSTHGSGLGLSISRDIVRMHRGDLTVTSAVGEGTTMLVRLPVHPRRKGTA